MPKVAFNEKEKMVNLVIPFNENGLIYTWEECSGTYNEFEDWLLAMLQEVRNRKESIGIAP